MEIIDIVYLFFFTIMIFSSVLWLLVYIVHRDEVYLSPEPSELPSVTFLVPAYNEEEYISDTISSILDVDYPDEKFEVIAINDGSTDSTLSKLKEFKNRITIIDKENTGKADSMNQALAQVETDLLVSMDADSYPEKDFLRQIVGYFEREGVKAVTPALKVRNPSNWVEKVQWTEYIFQIFLRKIFAMFDVQYVLPGPGSIYKADYVKEIGGWNEDTLTEDMEIAFRIFSKGWRLDNTTNAYVHTEPEPTLRQLFRQRIRWYRGYIENLWKYTGLIGDRRHGNLGMFFLPFSVSWILLVVFFTGHFLYNTANIFWSVIQTYMLTGELMLSMNLGIQSLTFFHLFVVYFVLIGIGIILLSLRVTEEPIRPWKRKTHYAMFLAIYAMLFAGFWMAAIGEHLLSGDRQW
ncbi:MAG: glycosyltransferase family 2 protein [Candidatus Nanohaloarchaeota archaeon QJJ-7]|nr:glycosyltransferase family 2 protein [Candidatus Nanohaloarchaeota archaeon QJJ-7]